MLSLPRTSKGLTSDQATTLLGLRVLLGLSAAAAAWALFDTHPTRKIVAVLVAGYSALGWLVEAVGLSLELQKERDHQEQWLRERQLDERLLQIELRIAQVASDYVMTDEARSRREWETLADIRLDYVRDLEPGDTLNLVSRSYIPPAGDALIERFQFVFKEISDAPVSPCGHEVSGERRDDIRDSWTEERFFVNASEATTRGGLGTIRINPGATKA